jgi:hypothetical protein
MTLPVYWPSRPQWEPMQGTFRVQPVSVKSISPYTGAQKAIALAQLWMVTATWNARSFADSFALQAFLESLDGPSTPIRLFDWWRVKPQLMTSAAAEPWSDGTLFSDGTGWGSFAIAPTVKYAYLRGAQVMVVKDLPPSAAALLPGDLFQVGDGLHAVIRQVTADAAGEASLHFRPGLRAGVAPGDALTLFEPRGLFRMVSDPDVISRSASHGEPFTLTFQEDVQ